MGITSHLFFECKVVYNLYMVKSLSLTNKIFMSVLFSFVNISALFQNLNNAAYGVADHLVYNSSVFLEYSLTEDLNILYYAGSEVGLGGVYNASFLSKGNTLFSLSPGVVLKYKIYDWHSYRPFKVSLEKIKVHFNIFNFAYIFKNCRFNLVSGVLLVKKDAGWKFPLYFQFYLDREVFVDGCRIGLLYSLPVFY